MDFDDLQCKRDSLKCKLEILKGSNVSIEIPQALSKSDFHWDLLAKEMVKLNYELL